jgi:uncharacterized lipoprotein YddW (UPF0748 family)
MTSLTGRVRGLLAAALAIAACVSAAASSAGNLDAPARSSDAVADSNEIRALWVLRSSLTSPERIATLVRSAKEHGFNTLFVQVRGRGDAYYSGGIEPRGSELLRQSDSFDPLATALDAGHAAGLRVHAWVNVNLIASAVDLPVAREHIIYRHPSWLMVPREIAQDLAAMEPESPGYVGKLARWTRAQSADVEGLYASPILPDAAGYIAALTGDLVKRYAIDGVHLDYARYPNDRFDYSRPAIREFRTWMRSRVSSSARRTVDQQDTVDLFAYPDAFPEEWRAFRTSRMTALIDRVHAAVKRERSAVVVSAAVAPEIREAVQRRLQDWSGWLDAGLVDAICPMAYATEPARFAEQISAAREAAGTHPVWAGIGAYRLSPQETIENIKAARRLGAQGVILFSYDSLIALRQTVPDYLSVVGRAAFAAGAPAVAGSR